MNSRQKSVELLVELFWSVRVNGKVSDYYSRVSLHEAPTKSTFKKRHTIHCIK